jgi:hypothetical protein
MSRVFLNYVELQEISFKTTTFSLVPQIKQNQAGGVFNIESLNKQKTGRGVGHFSNVKKGALGVKGWESLF